MRDASYVLHGGAQRLWGSIYNTPGMGDLPPFPTPSREPPWGRLIHLELQEATLRESRP